MAAEIRQHKVLFVDDEPNLLAGIKRQLRNTYRVYTAESGSEGLEIIRDHGPFPVVVSDMRMPQMNGAAFLAKVRSVSPNSIRVLLTGQTDIESAVSAINEGQIFRFLLKPCPTEVLTSILDTAIEQYRLLTAEKELLEKTLRGSIKVLTDILSLVNPVAFGRSSRSRRYVNHMVGKLQLTGRWQYDLAAMLSQIGCVTIPNEILDKVYTNQSLSDREREIYGAHPDTAYDLISKIPRLRLVAQMIKEQMRPIGNDQNKVLTDLPVTTLGGQMLAIALEMDRHMIGGDSVSTAVARLKHQPHIYHPALLDEVSDVEDVRAEEISKMVKPGQMTARMIIDEDIALNNGMLIAAKGQEVTDAMAMRLKILVERNELKDVYRVIERPG